MSHPGAVAALIKHALARAIPELKVVEKWFPADQPLAAAKDVWFEIASDRRPTEQRLIVRPRGDGDIQVEYHDAGKRGSPFEMLLLGDGEAECAEVAARFVADLISERVVLAYERSLLTGGRRFLRPEKLNREGPAIFAWVTSWRGTYDRN